ncbi:MAG: WYL domain-containing protein [Phycisphaerae bacterium]|nr:WYL domain-containing protein [Phycisphaerae bacterium]
MPPKSPSEKPAVGVPPRTGPAALARIFRIDKELRSGRPVTCARLAADLEVNVRTVRRDINFMRDRQGAPIEFDSRANTYRYTDLQYVLPMVRLSEGELLYLLTAEQFVRQARGTPLADTLHSLYSKICERMTDPVDVDPVIVRGQVSFHAAPGRLIDERMWSNAFAALRACRVIEMTYQGLKDETPSPRRVEPLHIACVDGDWYLIARNEGTREVRHFAMSRIGQVRVTEDNFEWEHYDPETLLSNRFGRFIGRPGDCLRVVLEFVPEVAQAVKERSWHPRQELKELRDGRTRLTLPIPKDAVAEIRRFVLGWGSRVKVIQPRELREVVIDEARAMLKANGCE